MALYDYFGFLSASDLSFMSNQQNSEEMGACTEGIVMEEGVAVSVPEGVAEKGQPEMPTVAILVLDDGSAERLNACRRRRRRIFTALFALFVVLAVVHHQRHRMHHFCHGAAGFGSAATNPVNHHNHHSVRSGDMVVGGSGAQVSASATTRNGYVHIEVETITPNHQRKVPDAQQQQAADSWADEVRQRWERISTHIRDRFAQNAQAPAKEALPAPHRR